MGKSRLPKPDPRTKKTELKPRNRFRPKNRMTKMRKSMTPGRVAVCLIGPYTSKKVVVLKQLGSGLVLGACMNNDSVRRFPQKWLMATSSTVNLSGAVNTALGDWSDSSFDCLKTKKSGNDGFFDDNKSSTPAEFQQKVDKVVTAVEGSVDCKYMKMYLQARFTLGTEVGAHEMCL